MVFRLCRTSLCSYEEKPCEEAVYMGGQPTFPQWGISLNSLEELIEFCKRCGEEIVITLSADYPEPRIEIYDDYRE